MRCLKKRLLYVVESFGGGVFTYLVNLSNTLANKYQITIAYSIRDQTPKSFRDYFDPRITFVEVNNFQRKPSIMRDLKAIAELRDIYLKIQPDIIHLNSSKAGALGRVAFVGKKAKVFYTPHGYSFLMENISPLKRGVYWFIEKLLAIFPAIIIACGQDEFAASRRLTKKAILINNGLNIDSYQSPNQWIDEQKSISSDKAFVVYTVGRISEQKNPQLFNQIALSLPKIHFVWIGDGELRHELTASNISITGWIDEKSVIEKTRNLDIFILTSRWEGLPMSLIAAMYERKLCIVSDVAGNHDVISEGVNGYVCGNKMDFVNRIQSFTRNSSLIEQLQDAARTDVIEKYNLKQMAMKYDEAYTNE